MSIFRYIFAALVLLAVFPISAKAQCSPFQGLGAAQFLDNSGVPLTSGVVYSFQAGTSTQQATFTDSTCTVPNPNPITFLTGARVNIWLTTGNFYKFQLCLQNDGPTCAGGDILFSVDQVPGGATGGGGGGGPPFISGSPNPATSGILRCASGDQCVVFRNAANSANLAIAKDVNDVLSWAGGSVKFPAVATPSGLAGGFSWLWNDSTANRWKVSNNGAAATQLVVSGVDINTSDQVTQLHFGATAEPLSSTAPTSGQALKWNGTNIVGQQMESTFGGGAFAFAPTSGAQLCSSSPFTNCPMVTFAGTHVIVRFDYQITQAPVGCSTNAVIGVYDVTGAATLYTTTVSGGVGYVDSGVLSIATTAGHQLGVGVTTIAVGCSTAANIQGLTMVYQ